MDKIPMAFLRDITIVILSLGLAGIFRERFIHVYKIGHRNIIKSFIIGIGALVVVWLLMVLIKFVVDEARVYVLMFILPIALVSFSTGCALMAGLIGIDGEKNRFIGIIIISSLAMIFGLISFAGGKFFCAVIFIYGLGGSILSLFHFMEHDDEETDINVNEEETDEPQEVKKKEPNINWDLKNKD